VIELKPETISRLVIDLCMTILLLVQMGLHFWAEAAHEWIGAGLYVLFITHHVLNLNWYKTMFKGKYPPYRILRLIVDGLVFIAMIGLMVSGIMLSQHVFIFLNISKGKAFARTLHLLASYWGFVLMALHMGLHWNMVVSMLRRSTKTTWLPSIPTILVSVAGIAIAGYGIYAFTNRGLLRYMLLQNLFVFHDYQESQMLFYLDYLAMMGGFVWIAQNITKQFGKRSRERTWNMIFLRRKSNE